MCQFSEGGPGRTYRRRVLSAAPPTSRSGPTRPLVLGGAAAALAAGVGLLALAALTGVLAAGVVC